MRCHSLLAAYAAAMCADFALALHSDSAGMTRHHHRRHQHAEPLHYSIHLVEAREVDAEAATSTNSTKVPRKRGLAYNDASLTDLFAGSAYVSWAYNWGSWTDGLASGLSYVPMLWSVTSDFTDGWAGAASYWLGQGSTHLLAFNEPDLDTQANLTVAQAVAGYQRYMQPYAGQAKLGAPAVTNGPAPMGLAWLADFLEQCAGCTIDFVPLHWYAPASAAEDLKEHLLNASSVAGGRPIWLTEFGVTDGDPKAFLKEMLPWLDSQKFIHNYAYFMVADNILVNAAGTAPSGYGKIYKSYARNSTS